MTDYKDDTLRRKLAEIVIAIKKYGPNAEETKKCFQNIYNKLNDKDVKEEFKNLTATLMILAQPGLEEKLSEEQ